MSILAVILRFLFVTVQPIFDIQPTETNMSHYSAYKNAGTWTAYFAVLCTAAFLSE